MFTIVIVFYCCGGPSPILDLCPNVLCTNERLIPLEYVYYIVLNFNIVIYL